MLKSFDSFIVSHFCYYLDQICRSELNSQLIASERDYVSNLCSYLRHPLGPLVNIELGLAMTSPGEVEQQYGVDSIILFKYRSEIKICMFEAKWPRFFSARNTPWDSINSKGLSRFSSQINRQKKLLGSGIVVWEKIINEEPIGNSTHDMDENGSTCIPFHEAITFMHKNNLKKNKWGDSDLQKLIKKSGLNLRDILFETLRCNLGQSFELESIITVETDENDVLRIPVLSEENPELVNEFLIEYGFSKYLYVDLDKMINLYNAT